MRFDTRKTRNFVRRSGRVPAANVRVDQDDDHGLKEASQSCSSRAGDSHEERVRDATAGLGVVFLLIYLRVIDRFFGVQTNTRPQDRRSSTADGPPCTWSGTTLQRTNATKWPRSIASWC